MCLAGSILLFEASGAICVKCVLKAVLALYKAAGNPYGNICPVEFDFCNIAHLVDLHVLSDVKLRLLVSALFDQASPDEVEVVLCLLDPLLTESLLQLQQEGVHLLV